MKAGYIYFLASDNPKSAYGQLRRGAPPHSSMRNRYINDNIAHSGLPIDQDHHGRDRNPRLRQGGAARPRGGRRRIRDRRNSEQCRDSMQRFVDGVNELVLIVEGDAGEKDLGYGLIRDWSGVRMSAKP